MHKNLPTGQRNILIVTTQRSGSTWLMQLLNGTDQLKAYGEVFLEWARVADHPGDKRLLPPMFFADYVAAKGSKRIGGFLDLLEESSPGPISFKAMYDQIKRKPAILSAPVLRNYAVVHLTRKNILDVVVSRLLAFKTNVYHSNTKAPDPVIDVSPKIVIEMIDRVERRTRLARAALAMLPCRKIEVCYEDLVASPDAEIARILQTAGLVPQPVSSTKGNWVKTNTRKPEEIFSNYPGIARAILNSKFAWMLDSDPHVQASPAHANSQA